MLNLKNGREYKICQACNENKKFNQYRLVYKKGVRETPTTRGWTASDSSRRYSWCKLCEVRRSSERYRKSPFAQMFYLTKKRSIEKNIPFDLDREFIKELYKKMPKKCPVLGIDLQYSDVGSKKYQTDNSPSLDRIDPKKGYTKDNVVIMSNLANRIKTDATADQIEKVWKFLKKYT